MPRERVASRHDAPFWTRQVPKKKFDISRLMSPFLPRGQRFETERDAGEYVERTLARLKPIREGWARKARRRVGSCSEDHPCGIPVCAHCTRVFRRWFIGETLRIVAEDERHAVVVTVLFEILDADLLTLNLTPYKDLLRRRLRRSGMDDVVAIGGFEVGFKPRLGLVLHAHFCLTGATTTQLDKLATAFANSDIEDAFEKQQLRDSPRQLSYLLKIASYYRPGKRTGLRKPRAVPLPDKQFAVWARLMAGQTFTDLMFLHGARRAADRICPATR